MSSRQTSRSSRFPAALGGAPTAFKSVPARWKDFPRDKELGAGVIDVKAFKAETAAEVAERIHAILRYVAPDKLWLNPDCGFWETPRWVVKQKLHALVEGARLVRKELG